MLSVGNIVNRMNLHYAQELDNIVKQMLLVGSYLGWDVSEHGPVE